MFTIEDLIEKIYEPKTKDLFKDVYTSYTQGQYRATVVMLWTVVVCDLVYKLQYLRDVYNDSTAIDILSKISKKQKNDPKSSAWETELLNEVKNRTKFIDQIEKEALENLQKNRHLCAHPIITNDDMLYEPTQELTRALLRIALDAILTKSPLLSKEYIETILKDFAKRKEQFSPFDESTKVYFQNRYLNHLNNSQIMKLFKTLWKFVFYPNNSDQIENQMINKELLKHIFLTHKEKCVKLIDDNKDYFTYDNSNKDSKYFFNSFIAQYFDIYKYLSVQTKSIFEATNREFPLNISFFFVYSKNYAEHIDKINNDFHNREYQLTKNDLWYSSQYLLAQAQETNELDKFFDLCIEWYSDSRSYDEADILFKEFIIPNYMSFSLEQLKKLITSTSLNRQTYDRINATKEHVLVLQRYIELNGGYDYVENTPWEEKYLALGGVPF